MHNSKSVPGALSIYIAIAILAGCNSGVPQLTPSGPMQNAAHIDGKTSADLYVVNCGTCDGVGG